MRYLKITLNGVTRWEKAFERTAPEVQHELSRDGSYVRVVEQYKKEKIENGGA